MNQNIIYLIAIQVPVLLFSVIIHECAHGWMAERCGDDTARVMGRITLNPLPHIDRIGTILLPIIFILLKSPFMFAYAKPVPINPYRFNNPKRDTMLVSFAGPASNIILAVVFSLLLRVLLLMQFFSLHLRTIFIQLFAFAVLINVFLAILNLIPIPPLDGSGIVSNLLPSDLAYQYERLRPYGFIIFIALLYLGLIGKIMMPVVRIFSVVLLGGIV